MRDSNLQLYHDGVLPASMRQLNKGVLKGNLNLGLRAKSSIWFTTEII